MIFKEHFAALSVPAFSYRTVEKNRTSQPELSGKNLIVRILPDHPYQYLPHDSIAEVITRDLIDRISDTFSIAHITFVINAKMADIYGPRITATSAKAKFLKPSYPFKADRSGASATVSQVIDWFTFMRLASAADHKEMKSFPISVTRFSRKSIERRILMGPMTLAAAAESMGVSLTDHAAVSHPYRQEQPGSPAFIAHDAVFTSPQAYEVIFFPVEGIRRGSNLIELFLGKFRKTETRVERLAELTEIHENRPCQKCLRCVRHCPESLNPMRLYAIAGRGSLKDAVTLNVSACTECGLCTMVCPSGIALMQNIIKMKKELE